MICSVLHLWPCDICPPVTLWHLLLVDLSEESMSIIAGFCCCCFFAQIILALGNYMNSNKRGAAYGFKLQSLDMVSCQWLICAEVLLLLLFFSNKMQVVFSVCFNSVTILYCENHRNKQRNKRNQLKRRWLLAYRKKQNWNMQNVKLDAFYSYKTVFKASAHLLLSIQGTNTQSCLFYHTI